jgi:hypothetical protein
MSIFPAPRTYLEQAKADFRASQVTNPALLACHTRYFLQQAYEKSLKAYMLVKVDPDEHPQVLYLLRDTILGSHSPLADFRPEDDLSELQERLIRQYPDHWQRGIKVLKTLRREAYGLLKGRRGANVLVQLDATRQSIRADVPSYRYPFFQGDETIVPSQWQGWDTYQGVLGEAVAAVSELVEAVKLSVGTSGRRQRR